METATAVAAASPTTKGFKTAPVGCECGSLDEDDGDVRRLPGSECGVGDEVVVVALQESVLLGVVGQHGETWYRVLSEASA
jgi:hypothetical protein